MNRDIQAERAFGNLIERTSKALAEEALYTAHAEILRLRKKQSTLLSSIELLLSGASNLVELVPGIREVIEKHANEY
jgi:hypothetical protein